jgi:hypothetical protein
MRGRHVPGAVALYLSGVLLNLLPGLRDLRTPLAVGYLWLAWGWLAFSGEFPSREEATGVAAAVYRFADLAGTGAALAALSFVAYVLGAVFSLQYLVRGALTAPWEGRRNDPGAFLRRHRLRALGLGFVDDNTFAAVVRAIRARVRAAVAANPSDMRRIQDLAGIPSGPATEEAEGIRVVIGLYRRLQEELPELVTKLAIHDKDRLWEIYDRKSSEGEFRQATSVPLTALVVTAAVVGTPWWLLTLLLPVIFMFQGVKRGQEARSEVYQALVQGIIRSTVLDRVWNQDTGVTSEPPRPRGTAPAAFAG